MHMLKIAAEQGMCSTTKVRTDRGMISINLPTVDSTSMQGHQTDHCLGCQADGAGTTVQLQSLNAISQQMHLGLDMLRVAVIDNQVMIGSIRMSAGIDMIHLALVHLEDGIGRAVLIVDLIHAMTVGFLTVPRYCYTCSKSLNWWTGTTCFVMLLPWTVERSVCEKACRSQLLMCNYIHVLPLTLLQCVTVVSARST